MRCEWRLGCGGVAEYRVITWTIGNRRVEQRLCAVHTDRIVRQARESLAPSPEIEALAQSPSPTRAPERSGKPAPTSSWANGPK
jgi:hypothetical protein